VAEAVVAAKFPKALELEPGTYFWCSCGRSENQPWCDGHHKGTGLAPSKVEITDAGKYFLCQCKATGGAPFCDGSHSKL
jgi:CDGSH-type Zn-finger protein